MITFEALAVCSEDLARTRSKKKKVGALAELLDTCSRDERPLILHYLTGTLPQGKVGIGFRLLQEMDIAAAEEATLTLSDVDSTLQRLTAITGKGSAAQRRRRLEELFGRATKREQFFLSRLLVGELRQGALDGIMVDAVAHATGVSIQKVRRAWMLSGDLSAVADAAFREGASALEAFTIRVGRALRPMLAQPASELRALFEEESAWRAEAKLDGVRIQAHKEKGRVWLFSRSGRDMTASLPDVVDAIARLEVSSAVLDGEALSLDDRGRPLPFQTTMRRVGRRQQVVQAANEQPTTIRFFDVLQAGADEVVDAIDLPLEHRIDLLTRVVPEELMVESTVVRSVEEAQAFFDEVTARGHEGVMLKSLSSSYELGNRGGAWRKWKPVHTIELVVLAAEWGSGRRKGRLSNLHLGARDGDRFAIVGKTFKGLSDELLQWQTDQLLKRSVHTEGHVVHVRPELVVEIAFDGVQKSPRYPGGVALRFARVRGYREDIEVNQVETLSALRTRLPE